MLPAARLVVHLLELEADDIDEKTLGEAVLAHDVDSPFAALGSELKVPIGGDEHQTVTLHAGDGLADSGAALLQTLRNASPQRDDALFFELKNSA